MTKRFTLLFMFHSGRSIGTNVTPSLVFVFMMNSMVLTSGEVTGLSQDRVSKQDAVAGKHKKQVVVTS